MKKLVFFIIIIMTFTNLANAESIFTDTKNTDWYYNNINRLVDKQIISGYPDGTFKPNDSIKVDEFIKLLLVAIKYENIKNGQEYWASEYIDKSKELGILTDTDFAIASGGHDYTRMITREEMALLINRGLKDKEETVIKNIEELQAYSKLMKDYENINSNINSGAAEVYAKGILTGYPDGNFKPNRSLTRAEATTVILRVIEKSERVNIEKPGEEKLAVMPKNAEDFFRIDPNIPTRLYEYAYNKKAKYDVDAFSNNKTLYNYKTFDQVYGGNGKMLIEKIKKYSKEYLDSVYDMDYTRNTIEARDKIRCHMNDSKYNEAYIDSLVQKIKDNKIISKYEFLTDDSLVYQDRQGDIRVRGVFKIMYISNESKKCITTDIEYNDLKDTSIEFNKWYERDMEIVFTRSGGYGLWSRSDYTWSDEITLN